MCDMKDEKHRVALFVQVSSIFSVDDIVDEFDLVEVPDAVYAVIGELLERGLIEDTNERMMTRSGSFAKVYKVLADQRNELDNYVSTLNRRRMQPDTEGKPRGLSFRLAEHLAEQVVNRSGTMEDAEKHDVLTALEKYLALAQMEEAQDYQPESRQSGITEGYLRLLYGEYLRARQQWPNSIIQLLISSRVFDKNNLTDRRQIAEQRACQVLVDEYVRVKKIPDYNRVRALINFAQLAEKVARTAVEEGTRAPVFESLCRLILGEVATFIERLPRSSGDFITVVQGGWTASNRLNSSEFASFDSQINEARLLMMNGQRMEALRFLEKCLSNREMYHEEISPLSTGESRRTIETYLVSLRAYDVLDNLMAAIQANKTDLLHEQASTLRLLEFERLLPFYVTDVLDKARAVINRIVEMNVALARETARRAPSNFSDAPFSGTQQVSRAIPDEKPALDVESPFGVGSLKAETRLEAQSSSDGDIQEWLSWGQSSLTSGILQIGRAHV